MFTPPPEQQDRMEKLGVHPADLEETFIRSSGKGGQNVNKVSTCVHLTHLPSGFSVKCMSHRTQAKNRQAALHRLLDKIESHRRELREEKQQSREKLERRSRPRPPRVKRGILAEKRRTSEKKSRRGKVDPDA
ncbi:MAG: peptide chain release factor-like protein [Opitutales bacterium]